MLTKLKVTLNCEEKLDYGVSSLMQGVIMELIDEEYADRLHIPGLNPYTQHVEFKENNIEWIITTTNEEAKYQIIDVILDDSIKEINIRHKDITLKIVNKEIETLSYDELLNNTYFGDCKSYINLNFITPTSFKVNGKYQFYPTAINILKSLINKHDSISKTTEFYSDDLIEQIESRVEITRYKLRSTYFHLEGVRIPAFMGSVTLHVKGPKQFINLINMLVKLGEFSGVGMKTAIGMGAVKLASGNRKE